MHVFRAQSPQKCLAYLQSRDTQVLTTLRQEMEEVESFESETKSSLYA